MSDKPTLEELIKKALEDAPSLEGYTTKQLAELVDIKHPRSIGYSRDIVKHFKVKKGIE